MIGRLFVSGARELLHQPGRLAATVAGVAAVVYLCGLFVLAGTALDAAFGRDQGRVRFQVYWKPGADTALIARQMDWMRALPGLVATQVFTPSQALALLGHSLGPQADLSAFAARNPLPQTMLLTFRPPVAEEGFARDMYKRLSGVEGVAEVRYDPHAMDAALAVGLVARRAVLPLAGLLTLLVGLVVGGMVRLSMLRRREELEILRLVGASEWYIRLPLAAGATLTGLCGAGVALAALKLTQAALAYALDVPPLFFRLPFMPAWLAVALALAAAFVAGLAGLAAALEPRS
ncbi:protein of unknown function DUF214 [Solidesulfovibrio fructosivorans JJ]]|uniref:Cell division protein FtsX n=1 Tax=Solidesulfovibrio fructosivorans JJ] TaxID=596151 RepID=E1JV51_SOLFR|nr:FtsX-like permease family protein [Solidesulfovibrio fructosivorans]EFL51645.1 protein of unknown function DUF214 [Solidesulfovibrio fructosivorans JJ]]